VFHHKYKEILESDWLFEHLLHGFRVTLLLLESLRHLRELPSDGCT